MKRDKLFINQKGGMPLKLTIKKIRIVNVSSKGHRQPTLHQLQEDAVTTYGTRNKMEKTNKEKNYEKRRRNGGDGGLVNLK